ncbi:MAG: hypothetical protein J5798_11980 [Spirochaetaceae bacterium]|nr:hypothetical protein [Spirochaetaceae bacterium]
MKKMLEVLVLFSILLVLVSCSGVGGGSSRGLLVPTGAPTVVANDTLAAFAASLGVNLLMDFNTKNNTVVYKAYINDNFVVDTNYYDFVLDGNFENGTLSFNGEDSIAIKDGTFNFEAGDGVHTFRKTAQSCDTVQFTCPVSEKIILDFKNTFVYKLNGRGVLSGITGSGTHLITDGNFNSGTIMIDGKNYTIANGSFNINKVVKDAYGTRRNLPLTFVKQ